MKTRWFADIIRKREGLTFVYRSCGVGFWDRGYPDDVADPLTAACKKYGEAYLMPEDIGQEGEE